MAKPTSRADGPDAPPDDAPQGVSAREACAHWEAVCGWRRTLIRATTASVMATAASRARAQSRLDALDAEIERQVARGGLVRLPSSSDDETLRAVAEILAIAKERAGFLRHHGRAYVEPLDDKGIKRLRGTLRRHLTAEAPGDLREAIHGLRVSFPALPLAEEALSIPDTVDLDPADSGLVDHFLRPQELVVRAMCRPDVVTALVESGPQQAAALVLSYLDPDRHGAASAVVARAQRVRRRSGASTRRRPPAKS